MRKKIHSDSSQSTPEVIFDSSSPAYSAVEEEDSSPVSYTYDETESTSSSPDPFFIVEEASTYSGWSHPTHPVTLSSIYKRGMKRPSYTSTSYSADEDDVDTVQGDSDDADMLGIPPKEATVKRLRSPISVRTSGKLRYIMKQPEIEEDEMMVTMSRDNTAGNSFGRIFMRKPNRPGPSQVQEDKKSNKKQKVDYFYVDGNARKVPPAFPSFMSSMYKFAEPKPDTRVQKGNSADSTRDIDDVEEVDNYNYDSKNEKSVSAKMPKAKEPMDIGEFETEDIERPLRSQDKATFDDVPTEEQPAIREQGRSSFAEFEEPSRAPVTQEPRQTVLKRPLSLSDLDDTSKLSLPGKTVSMLEQKISENKAKLRSRNIQILRQQFEAVVRRYNNGLAALSRLESKDAGQQSSAQFNLKSTEVFQPQQYGVPSSSNNQQQNSMLNSQKENNNNSHNPEKLRSKLQLEVRPSVHIEHHELSNSKTRVDSELITIIQKLLRDTNL